MAKSSSLIVVKVPVEQTAFDPDAVDAAIYCINKGNSVLTISYKSESFLTLDEENGNAVSESNEAGSFVLHPDEVRLIAEIAGWEWDGHVGIELIVQSGDNSPEKVYTYNFKSSREDYFIESLKLDGRIIPPL